MDCMSYEPRPGPTLTEQSTSFGLNQTGRTDEVRPPRSDEALSAIAFRDERRISVESITLAVIAAMTLAWFGCNHFVTEGPPPFSNAAVKTVVERIIAIESNGNSNFKNKRSSATGVGQFLEETWLEMIATYRPDVVQGRSQKEILELRRDPELAREIVTRLVEQAVIRARTTGIVSQDAIVGFRFNSAGQRQGASRTVNISVPLPARNHFVLAGILRSRSPLGRECHRNCGLIKARFFRLRRHGAACVFYPFRCRDAS
jgi:hypothetical protein